MRIRTRILAAFIPIVTIAIAGTLYGLHGYVSNLLEEQAESQLQSLAAAQENRLRHLTNQYRERFTVAARHKRLATLVESWSASGPISGEELEGVLSEILASTHEFNAVAVADANGRWLGATDPYWFPEDLPAEPWYAMAREKSNIYAFVLDEEDVPGMLIAGPINRNDSHLGTLVIHSSLESLAAATVDYTGLGESGETLLAAFDADGNALFLTPTRFDPWAALQRTVDKSQTKEPMNLALQGVEDVMRDVVDYRDVPVLAATRHLDAHGWGIVVKKDKQEVLAPLRQVRRVATILAAVLLPLLIAASWWVAFGLTQPIRKLTDFAWKTHIAHVHDEDTQGKKGSETDNEILLLESVLRQMTSALVREKDLLEQRVEERTLELREAVQKLAESETRLEAVIGGSKDGPWDWQDTLVPNMWFSPRFYELLRYQPGDFPATLEGLLSIVVEPDPDQVRSYMEQYAQETGDFTEELLLKTGTGEDRWFALRGASVALEDAPDRMRMAGTLQDIMAAKTEEARNLQIIKERHHEATHDALTGMPNRRGFEERWEVNVLSGRAAKSPPLVLVMDADHFKSVNDTWGHAVGDEVLKMLADRIRKDIREVDLCARFGGEEFVIALLNSRLDIGLKVINRLRENIAKEEVDNGQGGTLRITCSFGMTPHRFGSTLDETFQRADAALYQAKEQGRNRVVVAE